MAHKKFCCDNDCNQGRDCPKRKNRLTFGTTLLIVILYLVLISIPTMAAFVAGAALWQEYF